MDDEVLRRLGQQRQRAKDRLAALTEEAKKATRSAVDDGHTESELARLLRVDRMTIRDWLGKR